MIGVTIKAFGVFGLCNIVAFAGWLRARMTEENFQFIFRSTILAVAYVVGVAVVVAAFLGSQISVYSFT